MSLYDILQVWTGGLKKGKKMKKKKSDYSGIERYRLGDSSYVLLCICQYRSIGDWFKKNE